MNPFVVIIGFIVIIMIFSLFFLYNKELEQKHLYKSNKYDKSSNGDILSTRHNRVRCVPEMQKPKKKCQDMQLYEDNNNIKQKGFVNEMIYKPEQDISELKFENKLIENNMPLNVPECQETSTDLPIANINVHFLMNHQSSRLQN